MRTRTEGRANTLPSGQTTHQQGNQGTTDIHNKEGAHVSCEIWNFVLALSTMLDGYHPKQIIYLNLVCWIDLEHLEDLALSSF